ncbi:clamp loader of DNA polymerase [Clostridium phage phiCTP1]|uniref:clamp loader of DNA polymerase n=1 Tax=Clostridium phage phiCTP1 TaxID=871584 RepID=UPI0001E07852|nr:clamp loader of DNA polymerase [Clostridium phage phiCTP1]ADL40366.1 putative DNA polymerase III [Clostridium phage phiCTP1]
MNNLATKYRPHTFEDVVGQENVKKILENQVATKEFKQAYLFIGSAGTGKTTLARILANAINANKGKPIEVDGASNNGVENVRKIIDDCKFKALDSKYKIYIIDECHMLTVGAWNAMLKVIEEPPANTIFMFCTTNPEKIPDTILSRVQRFDIEKHSTENIVNRLEYILEKENEEIVYNAGGDQDAVADPTWAQKEGIKLYNVDEDALRYIANLANGGMRDAITMLDKVVAYDRDITLKSVYTALGTTDYSQCIILTNALIGKDAKVAIDTIEDLFMQGKNLKQFIRDYNTFLTSTLVYAITGNITYAKLLTNYEEQLKELMPVKAYLVMLMNRFIKLHANIKWESDIKSFIEAEVIMICSLSDK